jgi:hypothetical protein
MELFIQGNGLMDLEMDMDLKCGQTVLSMKVNGKMIKQMDKEN